MEKIIIGSRGSDLALWQAHHVKAQLEALNCDVEIKIIKTQGDQIQHLSFDKMEGKGFFTKEIEAELLAGTIDVAVHSHKDLETNQPDGLQITAVSEREDPSELILIKPESYDSKNEFGFKSNAVVGTSSGRRKAQISTLRPDIQLKDLRGNVPTRIQKLRDQDYDAIIIANAGVSRLELDISDLKQVKVDPKIFVPAPAQGVLGLQTRSNDNRVNAIISQLNTPNVAEKIGIERKVLNLFQGGCQLPLGVYAEKENDTFKVWAVMAETWDSPLKRIYTEGSDAAALPQTIVDLLSQQNEKKKS